MILSHCMHCPLFWRQCKIQCFDFDCVRKYIVSSIFNLIAILYCTYTNALQWKQFHVSSSDIIVQGLRDDWARRNVV